MERTNERIDHTCMHCGFCSICSQCGENHTAQCEASRGYGITAITVGATITIHQNADGTVSGITVTPRDGDAGWLTSDTTQEVWDAVGTYLATVMSADGTVSLTWEG